jgi:ribose transport system substrate-binding protein
MVDMWISETGTYTEPPVDGGPAAVNDKSIYIISCGESSSSCARATAGAVSAIETIGWEYTIFDTEGDYSQAGAGVRQAIAADADGVFSYFIDCSYMQGPLAEAKEAGIFVVQAEGIDCDVTDPSAEPGFAWSVTYNEGPVYEWIKSFGAAQAAYAVVASGGTGNSLFIADSESIMTAGQIDAVADVFASCSECVNTTVAYTFAEQYEGLAQQVGNELLKNPNLTQVISAYDGILQAGVSEAVLQHTRASGMEIMMVGGEGQTPTIDLVRDGVIAAGVGLDNEAEAWSAIDALNRLFQGVEPVGSGIGVQIFDRENNLPASGPYVSPIDYQSVYRAAWAVS